jgi:hypothetical protein
MPVKIYPRINTVDTLITVWNNSRTADYRFVVNGNPASLSLDKNYWILKNSQSEAYRMNIVTFSLPDGRQDSAYNEVIEARGGTLPYHFTVASGQLPPGLTLENTTGILSGNPNQPGTYNFTAHCTDSSIPQLSDDQGFTLNIGEQLGCTYVVGDANGNGSFNGIDVSYSVNYLKGIGEPPPGICECPSHGPIYAAADANGDCAFNGIDVSYSVNYLKGIGAAPQGCLDCPPLGGI